MAGANNLKRKVHAPHCESPADACSQDGSDERDDDCRCDRSLGHAFVGSWWAWGGSCCWQAAASQGIARQRAPWKL